MKCDPERDLSRSLPYHSGSTPQPARGAGTGHDARAAHFPDGIQLNDLTDTAPGLALRNVLIIDDSEEFRILLAHHLQALYPGIAVIPYDPPSRGRPPDDFPWSNFDLAVIDYELGNGENGLDWLRAFRHTPRFPPVIVMTAHGNEQLAVKAMKSGAQHYLSKLTYDRDSLAEAVTEALREREEEIRQPASHALRDSVFDKALFYTRLEAVLEGGGATAHCAIVLASIDDLEGLQQRLGLLEIDSLMAHLGEIVAVCLQREDLEVNVTRIGDGTVAALASGATGKGREQHLGSVLCEAIDSTPYVSMGERVTVHASIGIVPLVGESPARSARDLFSQADVAVRMARRSRSTSHFVRMPESVTSVGADLRTVLDLQSAIAERRLQARFQQLASVSETSADLDAAFYQCRVRIVAEHGAPPRIPDLLVEPQGRRTLDRWVIRDSLGRVLQMVARGVRRGGLLVRLSEESLSDTSFEQWLRALVEHAKAPRIVSGVVFELRAEDVLGLGPQAATAMRHLRDDHGAKFALLDIPSVAVLQGCRRHAPYAFTKLIAPGNGSGNMSTRDEAEFAEAVRVSHEMGAFVVAERVERAEQLAKAIQHGVDFAQGFFIQDPQEDMTGSGLVEAVNLDDSWSGRLGFT